MAEEVKIEEVKAEEPAKEVQVSCISCFLVTHPHQELPVKSVNQIYSIPYGII